MKNLLVLVVASVLALSACDSSKTPSGEGKLEELSFLIDWDPEPTYLGIYYAKHLGLFEDIGFDVTIVPNRGANRVIPLVANGSNPIGTASGGATVIGQGNGNKVVSLAVIYQSIPTVVYGPASVGVVAPQDLVGRRIAIYPTSITKDEFSVFLNVNGIDPQSVTVIDAVGSDLEMLAQGQADGVLNYIEMSPSRMDVTSSWPAVEGERSYKLPLADFGVGGYGLNIITSPKEMQERPAEMRALADAAVQGYVKGCEEPEKAVEAFLKEHYVTASRMAENRDFVALSWSRVCDMMGSDPGAQTLEGWSNTLEVYESTGKVTSAVDVSEILPD